MLLLACLTIAVGTAISRAATVMAPAFEWQSATPEGHGFSRERLDAFEQSMAAQRTKVLLVIRDDRIVCEWYASDWSATKPHGTASMAKALIGGLGVAVALSDSRLSLDDPAAKYVPQWRDDLLKSKITIRHLGSHTSGLEDAEQDEIPHMQLPGWKGDFWRQPAPPRDPFTVSRDMARVLFAPGTQRAYSNPGIAILGYATTAALHDAPEEDLRTLLRERVLRPIGVSDEEWTVGYRKTIEVDGLPLVAAWGGGSFTGRAAARVGRLMLHEGDWDGRRVLARDAVRAVTEDAGTPGPGAIGWWCNHEGAFDPLPRDAYWAAGAKQQILLVVPSLKLIAVRNGGELDGPGDSEARVQRFFAALMATLEPSH